MADTIKISGTDPINPKCAGDIHVRLRQIVRDVDAMVGEAGRLMLFSGSIREVLVDQGRDPRAAQRQVEEIHAWIKQLRRLLDEATVPAVKAAESITDSGVRFGTRFEWRPSDGR
jgi:hypothetical protein